MTCRTQRITTGIAIAALVVAFVALATVWRGESEVHLGLADGWYESGVELYSEFPAPFALDEATGQDNAPKNVRLWEFGRQVATARKPLGADFWTGPQQTGDCVSMGLGHPIELRLARQVVTGDSSKAVDVCRQFLYGIARVNDRGQRRFPCGQAGADPSIAAKEFMARGFCTSEDGCPGYSGANANDWGCHGVPAQFLEIAKQRAGGTVYPLRTTEELRDALCNSYPCSIAVPFTPGRRLSQDGRNCLTWDGPGTKGHQMCFTGYDGSQRANYPEIDRDKHTYFFVQNSHGTNGTAWTPPTAGEPVGGFWVNKRTADYMLRVGVCWAVSDVAGFPAENKIDWSLFDQFKVQAKPTLKEKDDAIPDVKTDNRRAQHGAGRLLAL